MPLSSAEPFFMLFTQWRLDTFVMRLVKNEDGERFSRNWGRKHNEPGQTLMGVWIEDVSYPNHRLLQQKVEKKEEPNVKNKAKKKNSCSCQLCGRVTSVKTPPYQRASSPSAYMRTFTPSLSSLWTEDTDILLQSTSSEYCSESIRCEPMPLFRGETFFVVIQTTSKHLGSAVSVPPRFSQRRRGGGAFIMSVSTLRHLARLFLSLLRLMRRVSTKQDPRNKRGGHVGWCCKWASFLRLWICKICFPCMFEWEPLYILMFMFVCVFHCFALTSAFSCTVAVSCFFFVLFSCCFF